MTVSTLKVSRQPRRKPPATLSEPAGDWWRALITEYGINDPAGLLLLETALQAWDRMREAQALIARDGPVIVGAGERPQVHPGIAIERDSRAAFLHAMKALNLDLEPLRDGPGRPPGH